MLDNQDTHCIIMATGEAETSTSFNTLLSVNIDRSVVERLFTEQFLEVRKFQSGKPMMELCAVVKCSEGIFWNIPRKILKGVIKK